jgi:phenylalanyl-tRNA synthetase alpha chain
MKNQLEKLKNDFLAAVQDVTDPEKLEALRVEYLGRKGKLAGLMKQLPGLAADARKEAGMFANDVKVGIEEAFVQAQKSVKDLENASRRESDWLDVTAPGEAPVLGSLHLVTEAIEDFADIFSQLGFVRVRHPEVDWDWYAFESLNLPKTHPARDEWETFFIADGEEVQTGELGKVVLTPHTSNGQVREMEKKRMPIRMLNINKTYRRQSDVSHSPMFHQFEGLLIDENVTVTQLKGVFDYFVKQYFGEERETRLRPFHFRFTEPSFELDITCNQCAGKGVLPSGVNCRLCKQGWLELGGAGMVHPNVLKAGGLDPEKYTGFAFGWGVERTMMMKAGLNIADIRLLYRNDLRFLKQF